MRTDHEDKMVSPAVAGSSVASTLCESCGEPKRSRRRGPWTPGDLTADDLIYTSRAPDSAGEQAVEAKYAAPLAAAGERLDQVLELKAETDEYVQGVFQEYSAAKRNFDLHNGDGGGVPVELVDALRLAERQFTEASLLKAETRTEESEARLELNRLQRIHDIERQIVRQQEVEAAASAAAEAGKADRRESARTAVLKRIRDKATRRRR